MKETKILFKNNTELLFLLFFSSATARPSTDVSFSHQYVDHNTEYAAVNEDDAGENDSRYSLRNWNV